MSTVALRYALVAAVTAMIATVLGMAVYVALEDPRAVLFGAGFGMSITPHSALLAMPVGLLLSLFMPQLRRRYFLLSAAVAGIAAGVLFGLWVAGDGHFFSISIVAGMGCMWALAALAIAAFISRSPDKSLERTRER